jgi:galactokinase
MILWNLESGLKKIYGNDTSILSGQQQRYQELLTWFEKKFDNSTAHLFSVPGRTEISGNHTDHNHGKVLAASINLDTIAVADINDENKVVLFSEGYENAFEVSLNNLKPVKEEEGSTSALIRGIAYKLGHLGYRIGGFNACVKSDVLPGAGLSSSAAIEVLIGAIFNSLYNNGRISSETLAIIGQFAENNYFGKPCGLMDQMACAMGGIISLDFENPDKPKIKKINFDFRAQAYQLLIVDTGASHADLAEDYAAIPNEMKAVANLLGGKTCKDVDREGLLGNLIELRGKTGDRAILRALHFFNENQRVESQVKALANNNFPLFLSLINASGDSSFKWLQNVYFPKNIREQGIGLALALTEMFIQTNCIGKGACRVHGGGFAGTIQVFLPVEQSEKFIKFMEPVFGKNRILAVNIRSSGVMYIK